MKNITMDFKAIEKSTKELEMLASKLSVFANAIKYDEADRLEILENSDEYKSYQNKISILLERLKNDNPDFVFVKGTEEYDMTTGFISFINADGFDGTWHANVINGTSPGMTVGLDGHIDDITLEALERDI